MGLAKIQFITYKSRLLSQKGLVQLLHFHYLGLVDIDRLGLLQLLVELRDFLENIIQKDNTQNVSILVFHHHLAFLNNNKPTLYIMDCFPASIFLDLFDTRASR